MIAVISLITTGTITWLPQVRADGGLPLMTLTLVGLDGNQVILHENDIGNSSSYRAYGGFVKSTGALSNLGFYTGIPITTFVNMTDGIGSGYSVKVIAADNFTKTLNYGALNVFNDTGLVTYDNVTGQVVQHNQTLTPMLAYYYNDANLSSGGPLRLAIVGSEGLLTQSSLWVSNIVRLELYTALQPMNLTLVALNGTQLTLNETIISKLPAVRAVGATRNTVGTVKSLGNHTGPSLNTLCNLVGGLNSDESLRITAADNYTQTLSYDQANGEFTTYDTVTGQPVQHNESLTPILAYYFNDANLSSSDGPLRLAIVGPEGLATTASSWVKMVVKLEIRYRDDIAVTAVAPSKTLVGQKYACDINVTVANRGGYVEIFNVTVSCNATVVASLASLTLVNGSSVTVTFTWNTTGFAKGEYAISAHATPVPGQTDTTNNSLTDGWVNVEAAGDITGPNGYPDGKVDMRDIGVIGSAFGSSPGDTRWNPNRDINGDGKIDLRDIGITARNFGIVDP